MSFGVLRTFTHWNFSLALVLCLHADGLGQPPPATPPATTDDPAAPSEDNSKISDLPLLADLKIPTAAELQQAITSTWIILKEDRVIVCGPVRPRPSTLESLLEQQDQLRAEYLKANNAERERLLQEISKRNYIRGTLLGNFENPEFRLQTSYIKEIWHHEDLMLKRAELEMQAGDLRTAYELLFQLQQINDRWPGLEALRQKFLLQDARALLAAEQPEFALTRLEELHGRNPKFNDLSETLGSTVDQLVTTAVGQENYREARHFLSRLRDRSAEHPTVIRWENDLQERMNAALSTARDSAGKQEYSQAVDAVDEAARIWPNSIPLRDLHRQLNTRYQRLVCGVIREPASHDSFPFDTDRDRRHTELLSRPLFEAYTVASVPRYRTQWFEQWEPTELGRNVVLDLRSRREYWSPQPVLTAIDLQKAFAARLDPDSAAYDERLAGYVRRVTVQSPYRLEIEFSRVPLRLEAALSLTLSQRETTPATSGENVNVLTRYFRQAESPESGNVFVRDTPEPERAVQYHIAEIREREYDDEEELMRGTFRGEVEFLPRVPLWGLKALQDDPEWTVRRYHLPEVHLLQFHPDSRPASSQELRRAIYFALDRPAILRDVVLAGADPTLGQPTSAPFPRQLYAYQLGVREGEHDLRVALSLALTSLREGEQSLPALRLVCEPDPAMQRAAREMIRLWKRIGLEVELVEADQPGEQWDIAYRRVAMDEPLTQLWPLLTQQSQARVADLQGLPGWLRQKLIELELNTSWESAVVSMQSIHADLWSELFLIPLWEVDRFVAHRRTVKGLPDSPLRTFQNVETWIAEPWFDQRRP